MHSNCLPLVSALALLVTAGTAHAVEPTPVPATDAPPDKASTGDPAAGGGGIQVADSSIGGKTDTGPEADNTRTTHKSDRTPWIKRYRPTRNQIELGIFGGVLLPNEQHELYDPAKTWQSYKKVAPDIGVRLGYYPLSFLGLEIEGAVMPTKLRDGSDRATLGAFRGYALLQLPYRIAPFALAGFGLLATNGSKIGNDFDPAFHYGGGVKFYINRLLALRVDVRDNVSAQHLVDAGRAHNVEVLLGLSFLLNRTKPVPKLDVDTDGDGFLDRVDKCVKVPGVEPDGCPVVAVDTDGDGFFDPDDSCVDVPGTAPDGCPDTDGDGFKDVVDKCPKVPGVAPDGCPPADTDGDGIFDKDDKCIEVPETKNNYKDKDGCPDEVPKAVAKFAGVIKGIYFDVDKTTIKPNSKATLDAAVKVLKEHEDVNVEISGHTDSDGNREHNVELSRGRAEAVRAYMVGKGIAENRLSTRGAGPDEPIAANDTKKNKALNRRIEFKLQDELNK